MAGGKKTGKQENRKKKTSSSSAIDFTSAGTSRFMEESLTIPANYRPKENNAQVNKTAPAEAAGANENLNRTTVLISAADRPSHEYMKQQVEIWKSRLATQGHTISPETREMLRKEVYNFEKKFFPKDGPSSSGRP